MQLLKTLLLVAPAIAAPLTARQELTCGQRSGQLDGWTLTEFDFHASYTFTTPAHQNSWGYISFNVSNPALDYKVSCGAASSRLNDFFFGEQVYQCQGPNGTNSVTSFNFNRPTGEVALNQSWTCYDDPKYPARYNAKASAVADLNCRETAWQNGNWTVGQIYSQRNVQCDIITVPVTINEITGVA
ncbi:hypothetical protein Cob_v007194 [Colletotrichum orbiculare MAFF 240422]|uniref:AA1-like domain-containing protein n=1 Tax=Colletotrichum orbiculare (strain 104-T / ATCC 96160 / CBS 514.97 / LARS 414 / MAFF 240422) TaxID=1213857 RepID=N4UKJ4_COLOR|nr:hypothetical protein Cob_v007194 [Colletotrichum orbiculare MAFF 240422]